jgi:hypothetical protein
VQILRASLVAEQFRADPTELVEVAVLHAEKVLDPHRLTVDLDDGISNASSEPHLEVVRLDLGLGGGVALRAVFRTPPTDAGLLGSGVVLDVGRDVLPAVVAVPER